MLQTDIYLHRSKDSNYELGEELGLEGEALNFFCYACYEVKVTVNVDPKTGNTWIIAVNDRTVI